MNSVYIVRSGQYDGNIGMTTWINVRVFTSYEAAEAWVESEKLRDKTFNKNFDFYEIEEMTVYDMNIHTNPDAREWVKFFRETNPDCNVSDDIMIGWFANAMMAMHDHLVLKGNPINGDNAQYLIDKAKGVEE